MDYKNERELQRACLKHARSLNIFGRKVETPNFRGFPDCLFIYDGRVFFVEFKHPNRTGRLSALQVADHATLAMHGAEVWTIESYEEFSELCRRVMAGVSYVGDGEK